MIGAETFPLSTGPFHLTSCVLFLQLQLVFLYLWKRFKQQGLSVFWPATLLMLVLSFVFVRSLGFNRALFGVELAMGIVLGLLQPVVSLVMLLCYLLLRPWELMPKNELMEVVPRLLAGVALLSWGIHAVAKQKVKLPVNGPVLSFLGLLFWMFLSAVFSGNADEGLKTLSESFFPITVLVFLTLVSVKDSLDLRLLRDSLCVAVLGVIVVALSLTLPNAAFWTSGLRLEGAGMWSNSNDLAALIVMVIPFIIFPNLASGSGARRLAHFLALAIFIGGLWAAESRGALLSLGVAAAGYFLFCGKRRAKSLIVLIVSVTIVGLLLLAISRGKEDLDESSAARMNYLIVGLKMVRDNPVFGVGIGNYPNLYDSYSEEFTEWGQRTAHSSWTLVMAEVGVPGLVLFGLLFVLVLRRAWRVRKETPEYLTALFSYGTAMSFLSHTYLFSFYFLCALIVIGEKLQREEEPTVEVIKRVFAAGVAIVLVGGGELSAQELKVTAAPGLDKPLGSYVPETSATLALSGSRNETLNFLLRLDGKPGCVSFNISQSNDFQISLYTMPFIKTEHASFPGAFVGEQFDPLLPIKNSELCLAKDTTWAFGEVKIDPLAKPGTYKSQILLQKNVVLPIEVTVWKMTMIEKPVLPLYAELTTWFNLLGHYGKWHEGEEELAAAYNQAMQDHRMYSVKSGIIVPPVEVRDGIQVLNLDSQPTQIQSFMAVVLKDRPAFAYFDFPTVTPERIGDSKTKDYFSAIKNSIAQLWPGAKPMVYLWDEPKKPDFPKLLQLTKLVRALAPRLKIMVTIPYFPEFENSIDIFVPVMDQIGTDGYPGLSQYAMLRKRGKEVWWYVSCMSHGCEALVDSGTPDFVIDRPSSYIRSIPWIANDNIDAFLYYSVNNGYQFNPKRDPWNSLWDFSGNGDGTLFYPGRPGEHGLTTHQPITSLRLKLWREASYDAEYLAWTRKLPHKPDWYQKDLTNLVQDVRHWDRRYQAYQSIRNKMGVYLNSL